MSQLQMDPQQIRSATSTFSRNVVLTEGAITAVNVALTVASPFFFLSSNLRTTLNEVNRELNSIRNGCNSLVATVNSCCSQVEQREQSVYRLFDGTGQLYRTGVSGGIASTMVDDFGNSIATTIDDIKGGIADWWDENCDWVIEAGSTLVDYAFDIAGIVGVSATLPETAPVLAAIIVVSRVTRYGLAINNILSHTNNFSAIFSGKDNPHSDLLEDELKATFGDTKGANIRKCIDFIPVGMSNAKGALTAATPSITTAIKECSKEAFDSIKPELIKTIIQGAHNKEAAVS